MLISLKIIIIIVIVILFKKKMTLKKKVAVVLRIEKLGIAASIIVVTQMIRNISKIKKLYHSDRDKTSKKARKDSKINKKEKSSILCKERIILNGNWNDYDNNIGWPSKKKSNL